MTMRNRVQIACICLAALTASACGVGELGASAAAGGASKAEEIEQAKQTQARIEQQLEDAAAEAAKQREAIEAALE